MALILKQNKTFKDDRDLIYTSAYAVVDEVELYNKKSKSLKFTLDIYKDKNSRISKKQSFKIPYEVIEDFDNWFSPQSISSSEGKNLHYQIYKYLLDSSLNENWEGDE